MRNMRCMFWLAGLAAALAACPKSGGGSPAPAEPVELASYCDRYAAMTCEVAARCSCLDGVPESFCRSYQKDACAGEVEEPVAAGRRGYDGVLAGECLRDLESVISDCSLDDAYWPEACDTMLPARVPAGGACSSSGDCLGALDCLDGTCTVLPTDGLACLGYGTCAAAHFCDAGNVCRRERGAGEPCPEGDLACASDLYCNPLDGACEPYLGAGQSCAHATYACASDLYCNPLDGACEPYLGVGQSCAHATYACASDLYCDAGGVCRLELPAGAACASGAECQSGNCTANVCEVPAAPDACPFL